MDLLTLWSRSLRSNRTLLGLWYGTRCFCIFNKYSRNDAERADNSRKDPGHFFKDIGGLFHAHELVGETRQVSGQSATLGVLNQHYQAQNQGRQDNQDKK